MPGRGVVGAMQDSGVPLLALLEKLDPGWWSTRSILFGRRHSSF